MTSIAAPNIKSRSVLFVDISSSTALLAKLGDVHGHRILRDVLSLLRQVVDQTGGTVHDQIGDELLCTFEDAGAVANAAIRLQLAIAEAGPPAGTQTAVYVRIGFHHGDVGFDGGQVFGEAVHLARRVASVAKPQQILTTATTVEAIPIVSRPSVRSVDRFHVKGLRQPVELVEIIWDRDRATSLVTRRETITVAYEKARLIVSHDTGRVEVGVDHPVVTIGRGDHCDLVLDYRGVSRKHASIEYRRGRFVYVDQSTNGSHVTDAAGVPTFVRNDELPLPASGTIHLGGLEGPVPPLRYRLTDPDDAGTQPE